MMPASASSSERPTMWAVNRGRLHDRRDQTAAQCGIGPALPRDR